jgi:cytochrome c-type biogenesis protein CcmH/NrfF
MVLALWWVPVAALQVGALIVVSFVFQRQRREAAASDAAADDRELGIYEERLRRELGA